MSLFDDNGLFGSFFDLDGDGKTDMIEEATAFALFDDMIGEKDGAKDDSAFDNEDEGGTDW